MFWAVTAYLVAGYFAFLVTARVGAYFAGQNWELTMSNASVAQNVTSIGEIMGSN